MKKCNFTQAGTELVLSTEYKVAVVYKGSLTQGIEPTTKWYELVYEPGTTPLEKDVS